MLTTFSFLLLLFQSPDSSFQKSMVPVYDEATGAHLLIPQGLSSWGSFEKLQGRDQIFRYGQSLDKTRILGRQFDVLLVKITDFNGMFGERKTPAIYREYSTAISTSAQISLDILDTTAYTTRIDTVIDRHYRNRKTVVITFEYFIKNRGDLFWLTIRLPEKEHPPLRDLIFQIANSVYFDR